MDVIDWLLRGDPAVRWQALRDLTDAPADRVERVRRTVSTEGWGGALLALQQEDGSWPSDLHPSVYRGRPTSRHYLYKPEGRSTFHTLLLLSQLGLRPDDDGALAACGLVLDLAARADGGIFPLADDGTTPSEACVTGMALAFLSYFEVDDERLDRAAAHAVGRQLPDGGWNCQDVHGATHGSMHTTIVNLEGLYEYSRRGREVEVQDALGRGREFLLRHRLFRSCTTGQELTPKTQNGVLGVPFTTMVFPPHWSYDVLRAAEHLRVSGATVDERAAEAIEIIREAKQPDGRWLLQHQWLETAVEIEAVGSPSRWNTLRALRVLRWWDEQSTQ